MAHVRTWPNQAERNCNFYYKTEQIKTPILIASFEIKYLYTVLTFLLLKPCASLKKSH